MTGAYPQSQQRAGRRRPAESSLYAILLLLACLAGPAAGQSTPVKVAIDETRVLHRLPEAYHGTNLVGLWNKTGDSPRTVKAFAQMNLSLVRFPGGAPCQWYDWEQPAALGWTSLTTERAWGLARVGGAEIILQTNTANDREVTNKELRRAFGFDSSGGHQAGWARFCREKGIRVAFWEIGNEPESDAPEEARRSPERVYDWYNGKFREQAEAIKEADPAARLMGPASASTWPWRGQRNLEKFLKAHGNKEGSGLVDAISLHWYPDAGAGPWAEKRGAGQEWAGCMDAIRQAIAKYDTRELPVYLTEWSWGAGDRNDSGARLSNALGTADCIGMFLRTGVAGHTHYCLQRIKRGWGVLAGNGDDIRPDGSPSPTYYALSMAGRLRGEVLETRTDADERNTLSAYATRDRSGAISILLINKTEAALSVDLSFAKRSPAGGHLATYTLAGVAHRIDDEEVVYNGVRDPKPFAVPLPAPRLRTVKESAIRQELPGYSMAVLVLGPGSGAK